METYFRIVQAHWAPTAMDGEGARRFGGRWNLAGSPAVYLADSRALAALEILVHAPREALLLDWVVIPVEIPGGWIESVKPSNLPADWQARPSSLGAQTFGTRWLRASGKPALRLPSVIVPEEYSLLLNPLHPKVRNLKTRDAAAFRFDSRLSAPLDASGI